MEFKVSIIDIGVWSSKGKVVISTYQWQSNKGKGVDVSNKIIFQTNEDNSDDSHKNVHFDYRVYK